jgi:hypothetical protein
MAIVTYGRPVSEYFPKLTLLETMGIIVACKYDCDYRGEARSKGSRRVVRRTQAPTSITTASSIVQRGTPEKHSGKTRPG